MIMQLRKLSAASALSPLARSRLSWSAYALLSLAVTVAFWAAARLLARSIHGASMHDESQVETISPPRAPVSPMLFRDASDDLPSVGDLNSLPRFTSRIAHEQGLVVVQMQTEVSKPDGKHLAQARTTLQLRGDYVPTKTLLIALLAKFPGLTLEHLTIRHRPTAVASQAPTDVARRSEDETTIEMIQYSKPVQTNP
jgi:hypothetical protein